MEIFIYIYNIGPDAFFPGVQAKGMASVMLMGPQLFCSLSFITMFSLIIYSELHETGIMCIRHRGK